MEPPREGDNLHTYVLQIYMYVYTHVYIYIYGEGEKEGAVVGSVTSQA